MFAISYEYTEDTLSDPNMTVTHTVTVKIALGNRL